MPLSGMIFHRQGGTGYDQPVYQKFEVSRCTHYDAMNGSAKCRKWGGWGAFTSWAMSQFDRAHATFYSTLTETNKLCCCLVSL